MALRNIVKVGDPVLTKKCRPVTKFDDSLATLLDDMFETMHDANGVGLAGPQVGLLRRVVVIDTGEEAAWELKRTLKAKDLLSDRAQEGTTTLYASDQPEDFGLMAKHFLQEELTSPVLQVNIDRY